MEYDELQAQREREAIAKQEEYEREFDYLVPRINDCTNRLEKEIKEAREEKDSLKKEIGQKGLSIANEMKSRAEKLMRGELDSFLDGEFERLKQGLAIDKEILRTLTSFVEMFAQKENNNG